MIHSSYSWCIALITETKPQHCYSCRERTSFEIRQHGTPYSLSLSPQLASGILVRFFLSHRHAVLFRRYIHKPHNVVHGTKSLRTSIRPNGPMRRLSRGLELHYPVHKNPPQGRIPNRSITRVSFPSGT